MTECEEVAESIRRCVLNRKWLTLDETRELVLTMNPGWRDGGESMQVIDNVAYALLQAWRSEK
jgi:hypothetical protein